MTSHAQTHPKEEVLTPSKATRQFTRFSGSKRVALGYLVLLGLAELLIAMNIPQPGLVLHALILAALLIQSSLVDKLKLRHFFLTLSLAPLIRLISLMMPLKLFSIIYWYMVVAIPLFIAAYMIARAADINRRMVGLTMGRLSDQLTIGISGLLLGYLEYIILRPAPLVPELRWELIWLPALILLIFTGFFEELIFRGLMQPTALAHLGNQAIPYIACIFAVLHLGYRSVWDLLFVFGVALFFGHLVKRSGSILGVSLAHGLINILLYLVFPLILAAPASPQAMVPTVTLEPTTIHATTAVLAPSSTNTPTHSPTPLPTHTTTSAPVEASPTLTPTPTQPGIEGNCSLAIPSRLTVGMRAEVISYVYLRTDPGTNKPIQITLLPGNLLDVIGGPVCLPYNNGMHRWWNVRLANGIIGWSAEGPLRGTEYFLSPLP